MSARRLSKKNRHSETPHTHTSCGKPGTPLRGRTTSMKTKTSAMAGHWSPRQIYQAKNKKFGKVHTHTHTICECTAQSVVG